MAKEQAVKVDLGDPPMEKTVLAKSIADISEAMKKLSASGLNRVGIIALIKDKTGMGRGVIVTVLNALEDLRHTYCR